MSVHNVRFHEHAIMIIRAVTLIALVTLTQHACATIAPEITTLSEGYNVIAKLPCIGCPFLYKDTSKGSDAAWLQRNDGSALLLNISLPYTSPDLTININNAPLLSPSTILPRIYATQILLDTSIEDISELVVTNQLDNLDAPYFGLSYRYSLHRIKDSGALVFFFDVFELWTDVVDPPMTVELREEGQKVLEVVLLQRPLMAAGDRRGFEIVRVDLVPRTPNMHSKFSRTMHFHDWDDHGRKGTPSHLISATSSSLSAYIASGVWSLFIFIMAVIGLFVVLCLFCIFGCGLATDEYESAQKGKRKTGGSSGRGGWTGSDAERGKGRGRFLSAEELGMRSAGKVVGVGKSD